MVAAIIDAPLDQRMGDPRHLGRHGGAGLAAQVGVVRILADVALVLVSEACSDPLVFAQPCRLRSRGCDLDRGPVAERLMRPLDVVVPDPRPDHLPGMAQALELVLPNALF